MKATLEVVTYCKNYILCSPRLKNNGHKDDEMESQNCVFNIVISTQKEQFLLLISSDLAKLQQHECMQLQR